MKVKEAEQTAIECANCAMLLEEFAAAHKDITDSYFVTAIMLLREYANCILCSIGGRRENCE